MSVLTSLARVQAVCAGHAQPIATVRHVHLHERPFVLIPLTLAGETNAPLAAMVGDSPTSPHLLVVAEPRNRDQRFAFAAALAEHVLSYVDSFAVAKEEVGVGRDTQVRFVDAPQVLVPNPGGIGFVRLLGRSTRFRRTHGPYAVPPSVPALGKWLTFLAERSEHPGSCLLLAATDMLAMHWATGQSAIEDQNLAALIGWIDPPEGLRGKEAAALAEDPLMWPPAGPATDPSFDNEVLDALLDAGALPQLEKALASQLTPTWRLMWRAVDLLRTLPPGARVVQRWNADKDAFTSYVEHLRTSGLPQPRWDNAVTAAQRLNWLERAQASYAAQRALDDPLIFAEYRLTGEAFAGTVTAADPNRTEGIGRSRKLRPHITVTTTDPIRLTVGTELIEVNRPQQTATIVAILDDAVVLELARGMGRGAVPAPGTVPMVGEYVRYTSIVDRYAHPTVFPPREATPWTHGGPPTDYQPTDEDAHEEWS